MLPHDASQFTRGFEAGFHDGDAEVGVLCGLIGQDYRRVGRFILDGRHEHTTLPSTDVEGIARWHCAGGGCDNSAEACEIESVCLNRRVQVLENEAGRRRRCVSIGPDQTFPAEFQCRLSWCFHGDPEYM
jgi:hypothetical protein